MGVDELMDLGMFPQPPMRWPHDGVIEAGVLLLELLHCTLEIAEHMYRLVGPIGGRK